MGKSKEPIDLILVKGNKHLTKAEIEERRAQEIKAPSDDIIPPEYLPPRLKKEFNEIAKQLIDIDIISNLDCDALARYLLAKHMYLKLTSDILKDQTLLMDKTAVTNQDKLFKQCRNCANDLGLTISSRCKLVIPKKEDEQPQSKWAKFGGRSG